MLALTGCSTPPGPAPSMPAPRIPADAVAYDDLLSADREFPFSGNCEQVNAALLGELGYSASVEVRASQSDNSCAIVEDRDGAFYLTAVKPSGPGAKVFERAWMGDVALVGIGYFRRFILDDRYYATWSFRKQGLREDGGFNLNCYLTVDTGSDQALVFREMATESVYAAHQDLIDAEAAGDNKPVEEIRRFMEARCPALEKKALTVLAAIDPGGGSLATG
ncbi:DUF3558 domain-containing protein [Actinokineospora pegani]|uniref:hypothetical protein n=1 Tax=Actinokineospora pegani TaxID=2654637 RepID=UPI0012EA3027|nr:hypothetical protein [Actinokineospora pegani]